MPQFSENKYLQSLLEHLVSSYETEINYAPLEIELDPQQLTPKDSATLTRFATGARKRLFIFKLPGDERTSTELALSARRAILNKTAETILKSTSREPKINPLKRALGIQPTAVRAGIQIQKSFGVPRPPTVKKNTLNDHVEQIEVSDINLVPAELPEFPVLNHQLKYLHITHMQDVAALKIKTHPYVFRDGIIPNNLPKGFYINKEKQALCYTDSPARLPSSLAPVLEHPTPLILPSLEQIKTLLSPTMPHGTITLLTDENYSLVQKNALIRVLPSHSDELNTFLKQFTPDKDKAFPLTVQPLKIDVIVPFLCKQWILGGEAHTALLIRLLNTCLNKKISLQFLKNPEVQNALLSTRGIKNLQKLTLLPAEQKEWWNTLVTSHLDYDKTHFDFNSCFEAYTQIFLPQITEKNLTLPNPCPIDHKGHLLITLNRVLDIIEHAENPQEQCLSLSHLNWGPLGVHYAMIQKPPPEQFRQVASCMKIEAPEDTVTSPELIYQTLDQEDCALKPWLFRYMGQHWKSVIRLADIQEQLLKIEQLISWTPIQKNQLTFILTCTFSDKTLSNTEQWKITLEQCIASLQLLNEKERNDLLSGLSRCFNFKPGHSLAQIDELIKLCLELKTEFPAKNFQEELLSPLLSCLENEGLELLNTLQERIQKTDPQPEKNHFSLAIISSFTAILKESRHMLSADFIKLLTKLNEPDLTQSQIDNLLLAFRTLETTRGSGFSTLVLNVLSQINITKSQPLPNLEAVQKVMEHFASSSEEIPAEHKTPEKQDAWLKNLFIEKNLLPGCILGNGDISKLDDLIVDALVDAIKKRSAAFRIDILKAELQKNLQSFLVPQQLRDDLNAELIPVFDAVHELVNLLQTRNPQFSEVIKKLHYFEEKKPALLEGMYGVGILGKTKGEYILSFLLTGKRNAADQTTRTTFAAILGQLHNLFISEMNLFFNNPENKLLVKDFDIKTSLAWMAAFDSTHSLSFFFKEELLEKKVLPALRKTLQQLNTEDPLFEKSILDEAAQFLDNIPSDQALEHYKDKIEAIANYLNLLIDIKDQYPTQFNKIYKQLSTDPLTRINYAQKQILINRFIKDDSATLDLYLKLASQALEDNPNANHVAVERAINGVIDLFNLSDLDPDTQTMFFKMSMSHNLKSSSPFPVAALNDFNRSDLPEQTKSLIIKQIIQILSNLSRTGSPELVQSLVQQTQLFLTLDSNQAPLCIALLKSVSLEHPNPDLSVYPLILQQLTLIHSENKGKIALILTDLAHNKKDDTVNLSALLEITKGLARRSPEDVDQVFKLFATPPYPNTQSLNSALLAHDSEKLEAYCSSFDTNPFAKTGEKRDLAKQFTTDRIQEGLLSLQDLLHEVPLPHSLQMKLAKQLTYIETMGYTDPLNPDDFKELKQLTASSRHDLKQQALSLLQRLRSRNVSPAQLEITQLELLAYLREIYFRTTGLFPNTTQMLVLLLALNDTSSNLLMRIKTGEGKSINTPMLSVLQWTQGGTVDQCTANSTLLIRDYENNCKPFFKFLDIESTLIQSNTPPEEYKRNGINCSTIEDMSIFRLTAKEAKKEACIDNGEPIHIVLDECDDGLLDQTILYKLVAEMDSSSETNPNAAQWIYPLAYQFINLPAFRNLDHSVGKIWDEEEDLEQFRLFLNKEINEKFNGDAEKQNFLMASSNTQLMQWIHASCIAATQVENKHYIVQPIKVKDENGHEITKKIVCVPLIRSTPKNGSIFTEGVQQALQARLIAERKDPAHYYVIDADPPVLALQSARGLIRMYQNTKGRLLGISATPGDKLELQSLATLLGTQAIGVAPYAGDKRIQHPPVFTFTREESVRAIQNAIDHVKHRVTKPTMEINADIAIQTHEEREALIAQTQNAIEQWGHSQTQPILIINEDFEDASSLNDCLNEYKNQGFKVQIVTGKETPKQLDRIIKQARHVNTITVGTAMLAKGIDIDTGDHPRGLFVIQTYPDTERMTTQIAGRAARNGKPGEWLPIYQIKPPQSILDKFLYYIFPWYRQRIHEYAVEELKDKIKLQATIDRLYTQAIDEAQHTLMQHVEAWESLLLEVYPDDRKMQFELYQWRETLLSELTRAQATSISESTLANSIRHFKNSVCKIWETSREEKWIDKAQKALNMTGSQTLRLNYLKQVNLTEELKVQTVLPPKNKPFSAGTMALMHQNLETIIRDKAGVVLEYTKPTGQLKKNLELAQSKQLLPNFIGEFCTVYPEAIKTLVPQNPARYSYYLPQIVNMIIDKVIEQKNRVLHGDEQEQIAQGIIQLYQTELKNADSAQIELLLNKIKPLLLGQSESLKKASLVDQFKMQGLIFTFCTLYQNSGLPEDTQLNALKLSYSEEIMKKLAEHLIKEFAWIKQIPEPLHSIFERAVAKEAADSVYDLAKELVRTPQDKNTIRALYTALQKHRLILKDKYLFSIGHTSPRTVINEALSAIDSLNNAPHCEKEYRDDCHDKILAEHHLNQFRNYLAETSPYFYATEDPVWDHLKKTLLRISYQSKNHPNHVIQELHETITRFNHYEACQPYLSQLDSLNNQLLQSLDELNNQTDGLKHDVLDSLFSQKEEHFARLFEVNTNQVRIQSGTDGLQSYIELQIENAPLKEGFTGFQSSFFSRIETEKHQLDLKKSNLINKKKGLLELSDLTAIDYLPENRRPEFKKLFKFKTLLEQDWNNGLDILIINELPEFILRKINQLDEIRQWNWTEQSVDLKQLQHILGGDLEKDFMELVEHQSALTNTLQEIKAGLNKTQQQVSGQEQIIADEEQFIAAKYLRLQQRDCSYSQRVLLLTHIAYHQSKVFYLKKQLSKPLQELAGVKNEEDQIQQQLSEHNHLLDKRRMAFISQLTLQIKEELSLYLQNTTRQLVDNMEEEFIASDATLDTLQKMEFNKSRYQTRRFFKPTELLNYEANLAGEEALIPNKTSAIRSQTHSFHLDSLIEDEPAEPSLFTL